MIRRSFFMVFIFSCILVLSPPLSAHESYSITQVRLLYEKGVEDASAARQLLEIASAMATDDPLILAYRGGAEALLAKHAWNPYTKLDYLNKSMKTLGHAIKQDSSNPEIRFIRFSIQYYVPQFLGYSKNLSEDAHVIATYFPVFKNVVDEATFTAVGEFMIGSGKCSEADALYIRRQLNAL